MKQLCVFILISGMLISCGDPKQEKVNELRNQTIVLHDEVMPRMGEVSELASALKKSRAEVSPDTTDSAIAVIAAMTEQIHLLDDAYEGMMQWMNEYEPRYEDQHPMDSAVVYYEGQKKVIERVKKDIEKSIEDGKQLLEINNQP